MLVGHTDGVRGVCALPDGRVVSASSDSTLRVWDVATGVCERVLTGHTQSVADVCVIADGRVASASADKTVRVWRL